MNRFIKRMLTLPMLMLCPALSAVGGDIDFDALERMVDSRLARAERGVLRDYFAQHGLEGDDAAAAEERYRELRKAARPDADAVKALEKRCSDAENRVRELNMDSAARTQMARMGVDDDAADDVLLLARRQLERGGTDISGATAEDMKKAVEAVLERLPQFISGRHGAESARGVGSSGNFPRNGGGQDMLQQRLDSLRAAGDSAAAVALINAAAEKGISLR